MAKVGHWLSEHYVVRVNFADPDEKSAFLDSNGFPGTWYDAIFFDSEEEANAAQATAKIRGKATMVAQPLALILRPHHDEE